MTPRILFATPGLGLGGAERWILTLCQYLQDVEIAGIYVAHNIYHTSLVAKARELGVRLLVPTEQVDFNLVITWGYKGIRSVVGGTHVPIIEVSHNSCQLKEQVPYLQDASANATHYAAVSKVACDAFPEMYQRRVCVIENGVDIKRLKPGSGARGIWRRQWGVQPDGKVVLQVGRLEPAKGPQRLIAAVKHLPREWTAVFVGQGKLLEECIELARGTGRRVIFESPKEEIGDIYAAADVVALPSDTEGMPLVMLEAWLCGKPVVCTAFEAAKELLARHGERMATMVSLPPEPAELAAGIVAADRWCDRCAVNAVAHAHYTAEAMAARWRKYIQLVMDTHYGYLDGIKGISP